MTISATYLAVYMLVISSNKVFSFLKMKNNCYMTGENSVS